MRRSAHKAFGMSAVGGVEYGPALLNGCGRQTVMNHSGREKTQPGMAMLLVVPVEEPLGEPAGILNRPEAFREPQACISKS